MKYDVQNG